MKFSPPINNWLFSNGEGCNSHPYILCAIIVGVAPSSVMSYIPLYPTTTIRSPKSVLKRLISYADSSRECVFKKVSFSFSVLLLKIPDLDATKNVESPKDINASIAPSRPSFLDHVDIGGFKLTTEIPLSNASHKLLELSKNIRNTLLSCNPSLPLNVLEAFLLNQKQPLHTSQLQSTVSCFLKEY